MILRFRVSVFNLFKSFQDFHFDSPFTFHYKPSMMIVNENEKVFVCLPEFDLEIRTKRSTQASGES